MQFQVYVFTSKDTFLEIEPGLFRLFLKRKAALPTLRIKRIMLALVHYTQLPRKRWGVNLEFNEYKADAVGKIVEPRCRSWRPTARQDKLLVEHLDAALDGRLDQIVSKA